MAVAISKTPGDLLRLKKMAINRVVERQGFREAMIGGAEWDTLCHFSEGAREMRRERLVDPSPVAPVLGQPPHVGVGEHRLPEAAQHLRHPREPLAHAAQRRHQLRHPVDDPPLLGARRQRQDGGKKTFEIQVAQVRRLRLVLVEAAAQVRVGEREVDERGIDLAMHPHLAAEIAADQRHAAGAPDRLLVDQQRAAHRLAGAAPGDLDH